ncbi:MAG TPA: N-acetylmuramoyl-L-alanine amidase, partial [Terriglobales bacterium]|nr:N-acetylmuramoyl-L-alanine amidase [Terriglobales bacterium]
MCAVIALLVPCAQAKRTLAQKKQMAQAQFENAEKMREALNGRPESERTRRDYNRVTEAFRKVYLTCANFRKADESIVDTAELLAETGRAFHDSQASQEAVTQFQFLMQQYPGSAHNTAAMFTIGKIYQDDLGDNDKAKAAFEEFLKHHPMHRLSDDARQALDEIAHPQAAAARNKKKARTTQSAHEAPANRDNQNAKLQPVEAESHPEDSSRKGKLPLVTGIRHWSTPDYTRVAIDLEDEVKYEAGRIPSPDRVFFDLQETKLAPELTGKSFDVDDGFLRKIRVAQYQRGVTRVVLEVDPVSEYSAFLLPNPYRLIIDIHGKPQSQFLTAKNAAPANSSPAEKEATGEKNVSDAKPAGAVLGTASVYGGNTSSAYDATASSSEVEPHSKQLGAVAVGNNSAQRASNAKTSEKEAASTEKTPMAVKPPAVVAPPVVATASYSSYSKTLAAMFPPVTTADGSVQRPQSATNTESRGSGEKATAEKSRGSSAEIARNDPAASLAMGKSNEPEVKATSKPTSAPTFEEVAPREERHKKIKEAGVDVVSREARPTADGQRSLIRALGLKIGRIVVDAGHGGHDTGTVGPNGLQEKDLVLDVALRLGKLLQKKMGAEVVYTRNDDTFIPLETRTAIANQSQADLFISVHANSSHDPSARGVETYYLNFTSSTDALEVAARENAVSEKSIHELQDLVKKIALKEKIEESREFASDVQNAMYNGLSTKSLKMRNRG